MRLRRMVGALVVVALLGVVVAPPVEAGVRSEAPPAGLELKQARGWDVFVALVVSFVQAAGGGFMSGQGISTISDG